MRISMYLRKSSLVGLATLLAVISLAGTAPTISEESPVPKHVPTWAYDGGYGAMTDGASATVTNPTSRHHVQTWISYAEAGIQQNGAPQKAYYDCPPGAPCKNVVYYDPVKLFSTCWPDSAFINQNTSDEYYLHFGASAGASAKITRTQKACRQIATVYFPNWNNPAVGQWFSKNYLGLIPENTNTIMFQDSSGVECKGMFRYGQTVTPYELQGGQTCETSLAAGLRNVAARIRWSDGTPVPAIANAFAVTPTQVVNANSVLLV